jgi:hypothetical protein
MIDVPDGLLMTGIGQRGLSDRDGNSLSTRLGSTFDQPWRQTHCVFPT